MNPALCPLVSKHSDERFQFTRSVSRWTNSHLLLDPNGSKAAAGSSLDDVIRLIELSAFRSVRLAHGRRTPCQRFCRMAVRSTAFIVVRIHFYHNFSRVSVNAHRRKGVREARPGTRCFRENAADLVPVQTVVCIPPSSRVLSPILFTLHFLLKVSPRLRSPA